MSKVVKIPDEVVEAAREAWDGYYNWHQLLAAALSAWPGAARHDFAHADGEECIILPLPKEVSDD